MSVVLLVGLVAGLSRATVSTTRKLSSRDVSVLKQLVNSACRMSRKAEQNSKLLQTLTDVQFGLAYVNSARVLGGSDEILEEVTGIKVNELYMTLRSQQRQALDSIGKSAPHLRLSDRFASAAMDG